MLFKALESDSMLISVSSAFSSSDLSTSSSNLNSFHVKITSDFKFDFITSVFSPLCLISFSSQSYASFSLFIVASDSEFVIEKMMIISCDLSFNSAQKQMFLEFEEYIEKKLCSLILDIKINKDDISKMKKNVEDVTINCREMQKQMIIQEIQINDLLYWIIRQNKIIENLQKQTEKYVFQLIFITQTWETLMLFNKVKAMLFLLWFFSSSLSLFSSDSFSFNSFLLTAVFESIRINSSSFASSSTSITTIMQSISEKMKKAVSFNMSFLSHSFCQYDSLCMFCAIWLINARVYFY